MIGKLIKINDEWRVQTTLYHGIWSNDIPLHPDDIKEIESIVEENPIIDIEIINYNYGGKYARLLTIEIKIKRFTTQAEKSWKECHNCSETGKDFYIKGYITAMFNYE